MLTIASGTVPRDICVPNVISPLSDLQLGSNILTGDLDLSHCVNLIALDAPFNNFSGSLISPTG